MNRTRGIQEGIRKEILGWRGIVPVRSRLAHHLLRLLQMLTDLLLLAVLLLALVIVGLYREARAREAAHGLLKLAWRWHTGHPWHGKPLTDAGWLRPASDRKALSWPAIDDPRRG